MKFEAYNERQDEARRARWEMGYLVRLAFGAKDYPQFEKFYRIPNKPTKGMKKSIEMAKKLGHPGPND